MDVGRGMMFSSNVVDGLVHQLYVQACREENNVVHILPCSQCPIQLSLAGVGKS